MNFVSKNGVILNEKEFCNIQNNRMFTYSDGFFETLKIEQENICFWEYHLERIISAFQVLRFEQIDFDNLKSEITTLLKNNKLEDARVNIYFYRNEGGLFTPTDNTVTYLIKTSKVNILSSTLTKVGFAKNVFNIKTPFSHFKTNTLNYVLAGIEKNEQNLDDIILLDDDGNLSECLSSNLFWKIGEEVFTPSLDTGCVNGVYRRFLFVDCAKKGIKIKEGFFKPSLLKGADKIFCTNVFGEKEIETILF